MAVEFIFSERLGAPAERRGKEFFMDREFDFKRVEAFWQERWEGADCFRPSTPSEGESYTILLPPPNVTGVLHMGHLLNSTLQDVLLRRARQEGKAAFWQIGTDHAGISMQVRVEKALRDRGIDPKSLSRDEFLREACLWRDAHRDIILNQLKKLGVSCDFGRSVHTLDGDYSRTVLHGFVELFRRGYIYRGRRMVNWCPVSQTALSDEEVSMQSQKSKLYRVRYEIVEEPGRFVEICTTRPETIPGDVAVAIHPEDPRYETLRGKHCQRPFSSMAIPFIGDSAVQRDFGTGLLKVTPAHDPVDFAIGERHDLQPIEVIDLAGKMNALAGPDLCGMDRFEARQFMAEKLRESGQLVVVEEYENAIGISERSGVPIEPRLSEQWFLRYPQVESARRVAAEGLLRFFPARWQKTYDHWLGQIHDWCISRQLRWGHRIPVWYRKNGDRSLAENCHVSVDGPADPENWDRDPDILDTWFSSAFWPLGTLGWPDSAAMKARQFSFFYPTAVLVTGPDILFFWVARMIMMALEFLPHGSAAEELGRVLPFRHVYLTGIIRDSRGRKMSKSLGNSPEPLELLSRYGADGVRFGLLSIAPQGHDILFNESCLEEGRNCCTKLWNAARFRQSQELELGRVLSLQAILQRLRPEEMMAVDENILESLLRITQQMEEFLASYEFHGAIQALQRYFRGEFCDFYLELAKIRLRETPSAAILALMDLILRQLLQLFYPLIPFMAEELWHQLGFGPADEFLQNVPLLSAAELRREFIARGITFSPENAKEIGDFREVLGLLRALKANYHLAGNRQVRCKFTGEEHYLRRYGEWLCALAGFDGIESVEAVHSPASILTSWGTFALDLCESVDLQREEERLTAEIQKLQQAIRSNRDRLQSEDFRQKAPEKIILGAERLLAENLQKLEKLRQILAALKFSEN